MVSGRKFRLVFIWALALGLLAWANPCRAEDRQMSRLTDLVEWISDVPLTEAQRTSLGLVLKSMPGARLQEAEAEADRLEKMSPQQRPSLRTELRARLLESSAPLGSWLQQTETTAGRVIVAGDPPLTQQVLDSFAEWLLFAMDPTTPPVAPPDLCASLEVGLVQVYADLDTPRRVQLVNLPQQWANLRKKWPDLSPSERDQLRARWKPVVGSIVRRQDKIRVASLVIADLKKGLEQNPEGTKFSPNLVKLRALSSSLRQEKDPDCTSLAEQLDVVVLNLQQGQQQAESLQKLNEMSSQFTQRSKLPATDPNSLKPVFMTRGGIFVGGDGRMPYRY